MNGQFKKRYENLTEKQKALVHEEYRQAYDFDPKDPLFGLTQDELSGPRLSRRAFRRLLAASGAALPMAQLIGVVTKSPFAPAKAAPARPAAQGGLMELTCGWAGTAEIQTMDPAAMNQVLQFQIASNVL